MKTVSIKEPNREWDELLKKTVQGETVVIHSAGKQIAALVPISEFKELQEDRQLVKTERLRQAMNDIASEAQRNGMKIEDLKDALDLSDSEFTNLFG